MNGIRSITLLASSAAVAALMLTVSFVRAETLVVDAFNEVDATNSDNWFIHPLVDAGAWAHSSSDPTGILGGEREIALAPFSLVPPSAASVAVSSAVGNDPGIAPDGALQVATQQAHSALVTLTYDGDGAAGLGGVDFTDGGTNDRFVFTFEWVAAVGSLDATIIVTDTAGRQVSRAESFPDVAGRTDYSVFFADFSGDAGTSLDSVDSLEIVLNTALTSQADFALESIEIVPEPASWALLAMGLAAFGLHRCGRRGRRATGA